jgi:hypothetical protein
MHSEFAPILQRWQEVSPETKSLFLKPTPFELWIDDLHLLPMEDERAGSIADFEDFKLQTNLGGTWSDEWVDPKGAYALRIVSPGHNKSAAAARIHGEIEVSHWPMIRVDFQSEQKPIDFGGFRGLRFFSRGEGFFRLHFLQPSISDWDHYSTTTFKATPDWTPTVVLFEDLRQAGWGKKVPFTPSELTGLIIEPRLASKAIARPPSGLFNGMIMPVIPYSIRGAIWYQGEGNSGRAHQYRKLLPTMIQGWRRHWKQGDFPFLIVQLPNYGALKSQPGESKWAELREAQLMCLTLPQTGLAVTIDVGEADDVHPRNKKPVGERLAAWALATSYGKKGVFSGPLFKSVKFQGNRGIVSFQHTGSGLVAGDGTRLRGFAVAGVDRKFHWAKAQIVGDTVEIHSREVANPVAIRYAWADNPDCNLYNKEGYPAAPFRTDDWPGLTRDVQ